MSARLSIAIASWLACVVASLGALQLYASAPGEALSAPTLLPAEHAPRASARPVVLVFLHERCPCSRASIEELARHHDLLNRAELRLILSGPGSAASTDWSIRRLISDRLPQASLVEDLSGDLARRYGARTSGHAVLYRETGQLHYTGGLTPSRGHFGACVGREALATLIQNPNGEATSAPVFGCPLFSESCDAVEYCGDPSL